MSNTMTAPSVTEVARSRLLSKLQKRVAKNIEVGKANHASNVVECADLALSAAEQGITTATREARTKIADSVTAFAKTEYNAFVKSKSIETELEVQLKATMLTPEDYNADEHAALCAVFAKYAMGKSDRDSRENIRNAMARIAYNVAKRIVEEGNAAVVDAAIQAASTDG